jgi:hypothetical protein
MSQRQRLGDTDGFFKTEEESQFSTDMTPLNLAAQKSNYTIVQLLLQRGDVIPKVSEVTSFLGLVRSHDMLSNPVICLVLNTCLFYGITLKFPIVG